MALALGGSGDAGLRRAYRRVQDASGFRETPELQNAGLRDLDDATLINRDESHWCVTSLRVARGRSQVGPGTYRETRSLKRWPDEARKNQDSNVPRTTPQCDKPARIAFGFFLIPGAEEANLFVCLV